MGRIVFEEELADPAALLDEFAERAGTSYIEKLKAWGLTFWPQFKSAFDHAEHAKD